MMYNSFWFGVHLEDFLFYGFTVNSAIGILSICVGISALVILHESIKVTQSIEHLKLRPLTVSPFLTYLICSSATERTILLEKRGPVITELTRLWNYKTLVLYATQLIIGYILMFIVMTYNVYLLIAVLVGAAIGHFLFGLLLLHITAQSFLNMVNNCNECQVSTDGNTTPVINTGDNSGFDNDSILGYEDASAGPSSSTIDTTVQIHCIS